MAETLLRRMQYLDLGARLTAAAAWFRSASGWGRLLTAVALGGISAFAQGPFYLWPLLLVTFPALVWLIDGTSSERRPVRAAAFVGWAFGFGFFLIGVHWIGFAFLVDAERHAWLLPFVAVLFPGGLALFFALATGAARLIWRGPARVAVFIAALSVFEWLRGHILTGFPWNLPGYVWSGSDAMFQIASVIGVYGLSLFTLAAVTAPAAIFDERGQRRSGAWPFVLTGVSLVSLAVFGWLRLPAAAVETFPGVTVRIVQPNVPEAERWKSELLARNWRGLIELTQRPGLETRAVVVWPEAAPPLALTQEPDALQVLAAVLPDSTTLLSGTIRIESGEKRRYFNSMAAVSGTGRVLATYDKAHLVPFGEYLPFYDLLTPLGVSQITGGGQGYTEGSGVRTLTIPGLPAFGPLICYEIVFPGQVIEPGKRPAWFVAMTDDSWFGPWTGPYQHLGIAKIRAAEEGLAVVRAANTGVSAIIDPFGRIVSSIGLDRTGILDGALPKPLAPTIYSRVGDIIFFLMLAATLAFGIIFSRANP